MLPYLALPRMGFAVPFLLPETRWALTLQPLARLQHALRHATISPLPAPPCPLKGGFVALRRQSQGEPSAVSFCCTFRHFTVPGR